MTRTHHTVYAVFGSENIHSFTGNGARAGSSRRADEVRGFSETGYSYFGARYYDSDLSGLFLSVDPMSDKYPMKQILPLHEPLLSGDKDGAATHIPTHKSHTQSALRAPQELVPYCAWNPVKMVDPDGREVINAHTKKVGELQKKNENLQNKINNCNEKKQLRSLNKKMKESQSSLKKEIEYEKLVNNAIQDLKDYGGDEFNQLDNLKNINGENVDVYIQMKSDIGGVDNPKCGLTEMTLSSDGICRSEKGANTVVISLSYKFRSVLGKTLSHEGGHTIHDVTNPDVVFRFLLEHPTAKQDGHDQGNPSGLFANQCENEYCQRKKR